jgi:uncharacterized protein involved in exopolysaccharide biosynthesis
MIASDRGLDEAQAGAGEGEEEGLDLEGVKDILRFVGRSPRRHPWLATTVFAVIATLGVTVSITMPRVYNSTVRLLAQKTMMIPALSNPNLQLHEGDFAPTKDVADVIRRRENIIEIVKDSNLVVRFYATRSAALRLKDRVVAAIAGPMTETDKEHAVVGTLEKKLEVTSDENSVTISVDWSDPNVAYTIVEDVEKNFINARYDTEVAMIEDAIGLLEQHAKVELEQVDSALADLQGARSVVSKNGAPEVPSVPVDTAAPTPVRSAPAAAPRRVAVVAAPDADLARALEEKRKEIKTFEDDRQRQLDALKQQLVQAQLTLTAQHPTVVALQQKVDDFSQPSPELARLKGEERAIMTQLAPAAGESVAPSGGGGVGLGVSTRPSAGGITASQSALAAAQAAAQAEREDPTLVAPRERLTAAIHRYQDVMANIESAKLQAEISRTAYRYRYRVITPAEVAVGPKKPIATIVGIASLLGAALIALLAAAIADWSAGIILETWQVRRALKLEVLTELDPPR